MATSGAHGVKPEISLNTGSGFKNFGTGTESESEKVTPVPATSGTYYATLTGARIF